MKFIRAAGLALLPLTTIAFLHAQAGGIEEWVDTRFGAGRGQCIPGPCLPHGSIHPSPETLNATAGGYRPGQPIVGFAQLHANGSVSYGNFLVTPRLGVELNESESASPLRDEVATASSYGVTLARFGIGVAIASGRHSALYRLAFPASDDACLLVNVARGFGGKVVLDEGSVRIDAAQGTITGGGRFALNWNPAPYEVFIAARVSATPAGFGTWVDTTNQPGVPNAETHAAPTSPGQDPKKIRRPSLGGYFRFKTEPDRPIYVKIAVSFTSVAQAERWLNAEIPAWDFDALKKNAAAEWRRVLSPVSVEGASPAEQRKIYSALRQAMVEPRDRTGDFPGFAPDAPLWDDHFTLWDTWKTLFPLLTIIQPDTVRDNIRSFIERHRHNPDGVVAEAFIQGREFKAGQGGDEVDNVIADAFLKHVPGIDWEQAYPVLRASAEHSRTPHYRTHGWVGADEKTDYSWRMRPASSTLAFAYQDYCVAEVARGLGHYDDYRRYLVRSANWRNVWDDALAEDGFHGFVHARAVDGTFVAPQPATTIRVHRGWNRDFYEGTWWEYSNEVPHDIAGLTEKMGGCAAYIDRLLHALRSGYVNFTNEPSFMTPWRFAQLRRPYLTSYWADQWRRLFPDTDLPGDDDTGAMSSFYIFLTAGFFPIAGQDVYYLHGARVPKISFHLPKGKTFAVVGEGAGPENIFVQSATLNSRPLATPMIRHADIAAGGTLHFVMGPKPSAWGTEGEFDSAAADRELAPAAK